MLNVGISGVEVHAEYVPNDKVRLFLSNYWCLDLVSSEHVVTGMFPVSANLLLIHFLCKGREISTYG